MKPYYADGQATFYQGDVIERLREMPENSVHTCVTSPPYWGLRDYGVDGQLGLEATPEAFIETMVGVFREVRRVLRDDGTCWINIGDSYAGYHGNKNATYDAAPSNKGGYFENQRKTLVNHNGIKNKDLVGIPWMLAFALRADGWYLRQDIIWAKPNPMPESVTDRCTKAHEYLFLLTKSARYFYDQEAIREAASYNTHARRARAHEGHQTMPTAERNGIRPAGVGPKGAKAGSGIRYNESFSAAVADVVDARNKRSVWTIATEAYPEAHFATFPTALVKPCILAGCPEGGTVLDPFLGSGTTAYVAKSLGRHAVGIDLNPEYLALAVNRCRQLALLSAEVSV